MVLIYLSILKMHIPPHPVFPRAITIRDSTRINNTSINKYVTNPKEKESKMLNQVLAWDKKEKQLTVKGTDTVITDEAVLALFSKAAKGEYVVTQTEAGEYKLNVLTTLSNNKARTPGRCNVI